MKGITPVIAIILLLLITISLVGFAFIYFTRVTEVATQKTQEQLEHVISSQQMVVVIDNYAGTSLSVRNRGTATFGTGNVSIYKNNVLTTCPGTGWNPAMLGPGQVSVCTFSAACVEGDVIRVTTPGGQDSEECTVLP
jgi:flagellin-like protein